MCVSFSAHLSDLPSLQTVNLYMSAVATFCSTLNIFAFSVVDGDISTGWYLKLKPAFLQNLEATNDVLPVVALSVFKSSHASYSEGF